MSEYQFIPKQRVAFNVTVRNADKTINRCLESLVSQSCQNWICVVTDDASTDATPSIINTYVNKYPNHIVGVFNTKRQWKMFNFAAAMAHFEPGDIVCELDGDDYVAYDLFVEDIQRLHQRYDVVWTQHSIDATYCPDWHTWKSTNLPDIWSRNHPPRLRTWAANLYPGHMRTFKRVYFDQILEKHLTYQNDWLKVTSDVAYFTPILEMVPAHLRYFYDQVCYIYTITEHNDTLHEWSSENRQDSNDSSEFQSEIGKYIQTLAAYETIRTSLCVCVVPADAILSVITFVKEVRCKLPFLRFHLFFENELDIHFFQLSLNTTYAVHLYNLDLLVNNSLSAIKKDLGQIRIDGANTEFFYPYCMKYVQENHVSEDIFFVSSSVSSDEMTLIQYLSGSIENDDVSGTCLYWACSPNSLVAMSKMHRENMTRLSTGYSPLTMSELRSYMTSQGGSL